MEYKTLVQNIRDLPWHLYSPNDIIYLSWATAFEFAESLRCALEAYPQSQKLYEVALGELKTTNLSYGNYKKKIGDHNEFLYYFFSVDIHKRKETNNKLYVAKKDYLKAVRNIGNNKARAITIFSREQELPGIFKKILKAHDWNILGFGFFQYYLERHIELDSQDGGHAELTKSFDLDEVILENFYKIRLDLYESLK